MMIDHTLDLIKSALARIGHSRSTLIALSGIDSSGKGYVARLLAQQLDARKLRTLVISTNRWLNTPNAWCTSKCPAKQFYRHAVRFDEMFSTLVLPLRDARQVIVESQMPNAFEAGHSQLRYEFSNVDVILLEGAYLFKRQLVHHYDLRIWIDCSFETALERAVTRAQGDQRSPEGTARAYATVYFPAQREHFMRDGPREGAEALIVNDHRLESCR